MLLLVILVELHFSSNDQGKRSIIFHLAVFCFLLFFSRLYAGEICDLRRRERTEMPSIAWYDYPIEAWEMIPRRQPELIWSTSSHNSLGSCFSSSLSLSVGTYHRTMKYRVCTVGGSPSHSRLFIWSMCVCVRALPVYVFTIYFMKSRA